MKNKLNKIYIIKQIENYNKAVANSSNIIIIYAHFEYTWSIIYFEWIRAE